LIDCPGKELNFEEGEYAGTAICKEMESPESCYFACIVKGRGLSFEYSRSGEDPGDCYCYSEEIHQYSVDTAFADWDTYICSMGSEVVEESPTPSSTPTNEVETSESEELEETTSAPTAPQTSTTDEASSTTDAPEEVETTTASTTMVVLDEVETTILPTTAPEVVAYLAVQQKGGYGNSAKATCVPADVSEFPTNRQGTEYPEEGIVATCCRDDGDPTTLARREIPECVMAVTWSEARDICVGYNGGDGTEAFRLCTEEELVDHAVEIGARKAGCSANSLLSWTSTSCSLEE
jgi:hypothetical protein